MVDGAGRRGRSTGEGVGKGRKVNEVRGVLGSEGTNGKGGDLVRRREKWTGTG